MHPMPPPSLSSPITPNPANNEEEEEEEEEDYMSMTFTSDPPSTSRATASSTQPETSLQRQRRLRREAEARSRPKSKAELAAEADARREAALSQSLFTTQPKSKGLAMMAKMGFTGGALGKAPPPAPPSQTQPSSAPNPNDSPNQTVPAPPPLPRTEPIPLDLKTGREGIGLESERKRKLREAAQAADAHAKRVRADETGYRERVRQEREAARWERQAGAAQKVAERMAGERAAAEGKEEDVAGRPLKAIPVVWRGLVRSREEGERDRRMRHDLEVGMARRLPGYEDGEEDEDDKMALGRKGGVVYVAAEDLDEEDEELEAFNELPPEERLRRVVEYLREEYRYCFWCKFAYPDEEMEGCPGLTEEDHD
ncbi:hypothetical protein C8A05DRAFT_45861 [Staphylotrichum tortipilum]|uniref:DUF4187 domain-containing protein n=1 Tax=Staphylotrichum tortipilum TaxID=2831512 RepID=A0AAN6RRX4_9PEZI|nr:hypothetical protein C8A05DRAFT_45861 [Staphylotrichum longicolle]